MKPTKYLFKKDRDVFDIPVKSAKFLGTSGRADTGMIFLILGLFVAGAVLAAWGGYEIKGSRKSAGWPNVPGTISSSDIAKRVTRDTNRRRSRTTYYPKIAFHYQVDGHNFTSSRIAFGTGDSGGKMKWAQKVISKYPVGNKVTVYYDPQDPQYGVLEAGMTWRSVFLLVGGIAFLAADFFCLKSFFKNR